MYFQNLRQIDATLGCSHFQADMLQALDIVWHCDLSTLHKICYLQVLPALPLFFYHGTFRLSAPEFVPLGNSEEAEYANVDFSNCVETSTVIVKHTVPAHACIIGIVGVTMYNRKWT